MTVRVALTGLLLILVVVRADAQTSIGGRGYVTYGSVLLASADTFEAVAGKRDVPSIGGGGSVTGIWRGLFVDVALSRQSLDGERVFVSGGEVFHLGIPLQVSFRPLDLAVGWRLTRRHVSPYAGAGLSRIRYEETGDFSQVGDNVTAQRNGSLVIGGVDVPLWRWIQVGGEMRYRRVKGVLGEGGASDAFDEDQLGGLSIAVRVSVVL